MLTRDPEDLPYEAYQKIALREYELADSMFAEVQQLPYTQIYQVANRIEAYREETGWDLLFVNEEPRCLRPDENIGYSVRWNETRGEHEVDALPAASRQVVYPASLQTDSQHKLCLPCQHLLDTFCRHDQSKRQGDVPGENIVIWHSRIASLIVSVKRHECFVCSMIMETYLSKKYPSLLTNANGLTDFHIEVCWDMKGKTKGMKKFYFVAVNSHKPKHPSSNYFHFAVMCGWPDGVVATHAISSGQDNTENYPQTDDKHGRRRQLASYWVERCISDLSGGHNACTVKNANFVPSRLLDVNFALQSGRVRLVRQDSGDDQISGGTTYCTLSHCWGKDGSLSIPLLRKSNTEYRSEVGISMAELPSTFREAIDVCSWFQVNYLWVDSLCIIQDSEEDWRREASLMSNIYQGAWLNISADVGGNAQAGLFREVSLPERSWPEFRATESQSSWTLTPLPDYFVQRIGEAPSFSRAWIHRERQLSRRILHFTAHGMAWECCEQGRPSYATESFPEGVPFEHFLAEENKYQVGRMEQELVPGDEETYGRWNDVCEVLSTKQLTRESDRPLILSTIAEDFSRLLPDDEYIAGLWRSTLPHSLLWSHPIPRKESAENWATWAELGPSWSWLTGQCRVILANRARVRRHATVAEMINVSLSLASPVSPVPQDPFGRVGSGSLKMRGFVRPVRLRLQYEEQTWELFVLEENVQRTREDLSQSGKSTHSVTKRMRQLFRGRRQRSEDNDDTNISKNTGAITDAWRYIGNSWDVTEGSRCEVEPDWRVTDPYDCFALFIIVDQSGASIECLLLEKVSASDSSFRRMGKLKLSKEFALKMRYRLSCQEDFNIFDNGVDVDRKAITPQGWINAKQQISKDQKKERGEDTENVDRALIQGVDGLYQFDSNTQEVFPWLVKLEPMELEII